MSFHINMIRKIIILLYLLSSIYQFCVSENRENTGGKPPKHSCRSVHPLMATPLPTAGSPHPHRT